MYTKIKDVSGFVKSKHSILNVDNGALDAYKISRKKRRNDDERINNIEESLEEIKRMLLLIIGNK